MSIWLGTGSSPQDSISKNLVLKALKALRYLKYVIHCACLGHQRDSNAVEMESLISVSMFVHREFLREQFRFLF